MLASRDVGEGVAEGTTDDKLGQTLAQIKQTLEKALLERSTGHELDGYSFAPLAPLAKCP